MGEETFEIQLVICVFVCACSAMAPFECHVIFRYEAITRTRLGDYFLSSIN